VLAGELRREQTNKLTILSDTAPDATTVEALPARPFLPVADDPLGMRCGTSARQARYGLMASRASIKKGLVEDSVLNLCLVLSTTVPRSGRSIEGVQPPSGGSQAAHDFPR